ncbi:MAG: hypothetical protein OEV03_08225 [Gammaproteobacteria bacterium]|nr:hypothetical protein [Gammaproteobacteria bacterium]
MIDIGSLVSSIVGLGAKTAGAIPGMKKPKRPNTAREVAKTAGSQFGKAVGAAQSGHGASRGLALREGLRQGMQAVGKTSQAVGAAAQADEQEFQRRTELRNQNIANFTGDLAKGFGDMAAAQIGPKGADAPGTAAVGMKSGKGTALEQAKQTLPGAEPDQASVLDSGDLGVGAEDILADIKMAQEKSALGAEMDDPAIVGPTAAFQQNPTTKLIESAPPRVMPEIEQALADKLHMKELALAEAERLGLGLDVIIPRINRRLGLRPGQSSANPFGVTLQTPDEGAE